MSEKIEAETKSNVSKILMQKEIVIKEGRKKMQEIESKNYVVIICLDQIKLNHAQTKAQILDCKNRIIKFTSEDEIIERYQQIEVNVIV